MKRKLLTTSIIAITAQFTAANATPAVDPTRIKSNVGVSSVKTVGDTTTVKQSADNAKLYWKTIDTSPNESLNFVQPNTNSVIYNYVTSGQATDFQGAMNANGHVVVLNDAGVTFTKDSRVNVGALAVAATRNITMPTVKDPWSTLTNFSNAPVNLNGTINAPNGYVYVMAKHINVGPDAKITADKGTIDLQSGATSYVVDLKAKRGIAVGENAYKQSDINMLGNLQAKSGYVIVRMRSTDVNSSFINLKGVVDTSSLANPGNANNVGRGNNNGRLRIISQGDLNVDANLSSTDYNTKTPANPDIRLRSYGNTNIAGNIDAESATGKSNIAIQNVGGTGKTTTVSANLKATGAQTSAVNFKTNGDLNINGGVQVGNGNVNVSSRGVTTVGSTGYINAQGDNPNAQPSQKPTVNAGNISIASTKGVVLNGYVDSGSTEGQAGKVTIHSRNDVTTNTKIAGSTVAISGKNVTVNNPHGDDYITAYNGGYSTGAGTGGTININSVKDTTINALLIPGNINGAGKVNLVAGGTTTLNGDINNSSQKGNGGNVSVTAKTIVSKGDITTAGGTNGGNINFKAIKFTQDPDAVYTTVGGDGVNGTVKVNNKAI